MTSILVVCTGNVCRSPIGEAAIRRRLVDRLGEAAPTVSSAGTAGWEGSGAVSGSISTAAERGLDISAHVARILDPGMIEEADLVLCMAAEHGDRIRSMGVAGADRKTFTLKELVALVELLPPASSTATGNGFHRRLSEAGEMLQVDPGAVPKDEDVADPLGQPMDAFRAIAWEIDDLADRLVRGLFGAK